MEFKLRDYRAEEEAYSLTRVSVSSHPLCSSSSSSSSHTQDNVSVEFFDPLRALSTEISEPVEDTFVAEKYPVSQPASHLSAKEWASFNKLLMQRFPVPKMISVSASSSKTIKGKKAIGELPANTQSDELNDSEKLTEKGFKTVSQQEYIKRLHELKDEIKRSWHSGDRVTSLKLSIKVARLLMDTCVAQFYPTLFVLATDIMDMLGDMVWERIKEKAEFADDGTKVCTLSDDFEANSICLEAKETCNNWFRKIASIHELLPRIYLELAIFPCWRFLRDDVTDNLMRLVMMIRGISDPLASAYCRFFLIHCAQKLPQRDTGHLVNCISDQKILLRQIISTKGTKFGNFLGDNKLLISLMEPTIEYTMRCIFKDPNKIADMIVRLELGKSPLELYGKVPWISIVLHYLLKVLPTEVVCSNALEILHLVDCSSDYTFDQCLNYKMVGLKLCEGIDQVNTVDAVIDEVIQAATKKKILDEYLKILDAYMDIILHYNMDRSLSSILSEIFERLCNEVVTEDELSTLQSIVVKLITHFDDMKYIFDLNYFVDILDVMHGSSRSIVCMHILTKATRNNHIDDPTTVKLLFDVAQSLHDNVDFSNTRSDDNQQAERLVARFVDKVDHGMELDRHLTFLVECRGAFSSMNDLKEILVHSSNLLATRALREKKNNLNFIKSCITFNEVTIPCIPSYARQLILYLETAEVSLFGGLISHADGILDSAVCCLQNVSLVDGLRKSNEDADGIVSLTRKLCSFMLLVPGNLEQGAMYIPKSILSLLDSQSWVTPKLRIRVLCSLLSLSATFAQNELPYHAIHEEVFGNDLLFHGDAIYSQELGSLSRVILHNMVDTIQQEPSQVTRGKLALEACNCIASFFKVNHEISSVCSKLMETAVSCLGGDDKYLQSTNNFVHKQSPLCVGGE
ncbi:putative vacuolar protein sorting-associated protein [Helianthus annuus]|uniref:Vacuolar protein sorting-associated protein n=1 Tax=Helianthus annuus TaxID=4232 RepID=A0A9K3MZJ0_HELAN|nr:VPS35 endosomal protein sorting factor-like [Helianthus annuus]XP_021993461.1 VPS35 endosomal protein sorting factor-like [Helianthus annuus]KAF5781491.1 putative vacuolar protein sorting-associated protein [Helianthus annuus]